MAGRVTRIRASRPDEAERLFAIWKVSVAATHDFVAAEDLEFFAGIVRAQYLPNLAFWVVTDEADCPLGFLGMTGSKVDSLFIDPEHCRRGLGRALMDHARSLASDFTVDGNEQHEAGVAFYRRMGFRQTGRSPLDDSGRPYPLLHMRLKA